MSQILKQSTASQEILLGPFLDDTDGKTAETGLTIANTDIKLWKTGATTEANKNSGGGTHIAGGRYYATLDATDTGTLGPMEINVHVAGALPVRREYLVLPANVFDALMGTDKLQVHTDEITAALITSATFAAGAIDNAAIAADAIGSSELAATAVTEIQSGLATSSALATAQADITTIKGYLDTEIAAILAAVDTEIGTIITDIAALPTANQNRDALLAGIIETGYDVADTLRLVAAALAGKLDITGGTTYTFRSLDDSADRIVATVDGTGRTATTLTP